MGYMQAISPCAGCGNTIAYNPLKVPSIRINGRREPVCRICMDRVNEHRVAHDLPPIEIAADAYDATEEGF